jgi:hypothetical protein
VSSKSDLIPVLFKKYYSKKACGIWQSQTGSSFRTSHGQPSKYVYSLKMHETQKKPFNFVDKKWVFKMPDKRHHRKNHRLVAYWLLKNWQIPNIVYCSRIKYVWICYQAIGSSLYMQIPMFTSLYFHVVCYPKAGNSFTKYICTHWHVRFKQQKNATFCKKKTRYKTPWIFFLTLFKFFGVENV